MTDSTVNDRVRRLLDLYLERTTDHAVACIDEQGNVIAWLGAAKGIRVACLMPEGSLDGCT